MYVEKQFKHTNLYISKFNINDIDDIISIEESCYINPWTRAHFIFEIENQHSFSFVLKCFNDVTYGYIITHKIVDQIFILNIAIDKKKQSLGYGKLLIDFIIDYAKKTNIKKIDLEVRKSNIIAQTLYSGRGFKIAGERNNFYSDEETAILMYIDFIL